MTVCSICWFANGDGVSAHCGKCRCCVTHEHIDGSGEGYCSCGAERCSLPGCDGHCVHPGGWVESAELLELRQPSAMAYLQRPDIIVWAPDGIERGTRVTVEQDGETWTGTIQL